MAEQLKVIVLTTFITVFLTFTYVQFIQQPQYVSWATLLLPENKINNLGTLSGLASQFGVNIPIEAEADLSSPSLLPELIRSRTFAEKILVKEFYFDEKSKNLSLLAILNNMNDSPNIGNDTLVIKAIKKLNNMLRFEKLPNKSFSEIRVIADEPHLAKEIAEVALEELESLNRFFKSETVNDKIGFIENRIAVIGAALEKAEKAFKNFNENNRQANSPFLQLERDRLERDVEIQEGVFLTLKQQLELAKIEAVQKTSIIQILDKPALPSQPSNKNLLLTMLLSIMVGLFFGLFAAFCRSYINSSDKSERIKIRRIRNFLKKKSKDLAHDRRMTGTGILLLLAFMPFYLGKISKEPVFFNLYSFNVLVINILYLILLFTLIYYYFKNNPSRSDG